MDTNTNTLYRKQGQTQVVDSMGNLQNFTGDLGSLPIYNNTITTNDLKQTAPIQLPQTPAPTTPTPTINYAEQYLKTLDATDRENQLLKLKDTGIEQQLSDILGLQGETQALAQEKVNAGIPQIRQDLQGLNSQILKKQAELQQDDIQLIANMRAEERRDTLLPFAQMGQAKLAGDAQIVRALKNAEIGVLNAQVLAKQGDYALAQQTAEEAVALKYAPMKERIQAWNDIYKVIEPSLTAIEKKQAQAQQFKGQMAMKEIEKAEENEKGVQSIALKLAEFGQNPNIVANAKTPMEAIALAGSKLQDPKAKYEIEKLKLDMQKTSKEIALLGTPTKKEKEAEAKALKTAEGQKLILQDKLSLIDTIKSSAGLNQRVGSNIQSRIPTGFWGNVGKAATGVGLPLLVADALQESTGSGQSFSGAVHRLASQEFIDNLIEAKSQGATFGALTDREGDALRAAATQLNDWEIKDSNGRGTGIWNIDEKSFLEEVNRIETLSRKAMGTQITPDEQSVLDSVWGADSALQADPSLYFNQ